MGRGGAEWLLRPRGIEGDKGFWKEDLKNSGSYRDQEYNKEL